MDKWKEILNKRELPSIDENKKSLAYSLTFEDSKKTLTDEEINKEMEKIILSLGELITAISIIIVAVNKIFKTKLDPINKSIEKLDENQCKNFLITFLKAVEKGEEMDEVEIKRAHEVYDHYIDDLRKNSYIHDKWEKLMK